MGQSAQRATEEQLRAALDAAQAARLVAAERLARLQVITADLAGAPSREAVIAVMTGRGVAATGAAALVVALLSPDEQQLMIVGRAGRYGAELAAVQDIPLGAALPLAAAVRDRAPVWLRSRADAEAGFPGSGALLARRDEHAQATLPLLVAGRALGALSLGFAAPNSFTAEDRACLQILAQQCAQALERVRLHTALLHSQGRLQQLAQRLIAAQEQERRHLARELHDEVGQALTGLRLTLELADRQPQAERAGRLTTARQATQDLIARIATLALDLRPAMLDDQGLLPAMLWQLKRYHEQTGILVELRHQGLERRLPPAVETVAYRVVQEALTNLARHAEVAAATVSLLASPSHLLAQVRDAGRGFVLADALASERSCGLAGMHERVALLEGTLSIETAPGAGTCVTVELPLKGAPES